MTDQPAVDPAKIPPQDATLARARDLINKLWSDPTVGSQVRAKAKEIFPDIKIPEDDFNPIVAPLKAENEKLAKALKDIQDERAAEKKAAEEATINQSMEKALAKAREKYALTDEGFNKMVERMKETKNFTDAEAAAAWVTDHEPVKKPISGPSWQPQALDLYGSKKQNEDYALLHKDPEAFFDQTVQQILSERAA